MIEQGKKEMVERASHEHTELISKYALFEDAAIAIKHDLKHSGIKIELKENYIHIYYLDEELIFKYKSCIKDSVISGRIIVTHRHKELDNTLTTTPITEFYFDRLGNVFQNSDMKNSMGNLGNESDVYSLITEAALILLESDFFSPGQD